MSLVAKDLSRRAPARHYHEKNRERDGEYVLLNKQMFIEATVPTQVCVGTAHFGFSVRINNGVSGSFGGFYLNLA